MKHHNNHLHLPVAPGMGEAGLGLASNGDSGGDGSGDKVSMWNCRDVSSFLDCNLYKIEFCTIQMTMSMYYIAFTMYLAHHLIENLKRKYLAQCLI